MNKRRLKQIGDLNASAAGQKSPLHTTRSAKSFFRMSRYAEASHKAEAVLERGYVRLVSQEDVTVEGAALEHNLKLRKSNAPAMVPPAPAPVLHQHRHPCRLCRRLCPRPQPRSYRWLQHNHPTPSEVSEGGLRQRGRVDPALLVSPRRHLNWPRRIRETKG